VGGFIDDPELLVRYSRLDFEEGEFGQWSLNISVRSTTTTTRTVTSTGRRRTDPAGRGVVLSWIITGAVCVALASLGSALRYGSTSIRSAARGRMRCRHRLAV
jgi:hypothetical protein